MGCRRYSSQKPDLHECLLQPYHVGQMAQGVGMVWFCLPCFAWGGGGGGVVVVDLFASFFFCFELLFIVGGELLIVA